MTRRPPPSSLNLSLTRPLPGQPLPRWPVFTVPSLPPLAFSAPVRTRSLSVGTGVVVGELPGLHEEEKSRAKGEGEGKK